jgi:hypothetical protein
LESHGPSWLEAKEIKHQMQTIINLGGAREILGRLSKKTREHHFLQPLFGIYLGSLIHYYNSSILYIFLISLVKMIVEEGTVQC